MGDGKLDDEHLREAMLYDKFSVRHSQGACLAETFHMLAEMTRNFDDVSVTKDQYGDYSSKSRVVVWTFQLLISEAARDDEGGA